MENNAQKSIWETYTKSWSQSDTSQRLRLFEQCLSPDCVYTDPKIQASGYDNLSAYMSEFQKNVPGGRFATTDFRNHHDRSLAQWEMQDGIGNTLIRGVSFAVYGADGRLKQMTGFFEPLKPG
jgi:hypothetical protein